MSTPTLNVSDTLSLPLDWRNPHLATVGGGEQGRVILSKLRKLGPVEKGARRVADEFMQAIGR